MLSCERYRDEQNTALLFKCSYLVGEADTRVSSNQADNEKGTEYEKGIREKLVPRGRTQKALLKASI